MHHYAAAVLIVYRTYSDAWPHTRLTLELILGRTIQKNFEKMNGFARMERTS